MGIRVTFWAFFRPAEQGDSERIFRDFEAMGAWGESEERRAGTREKEIEFDTRLSKNARARARRFGSINSIRSSGGAKTPRRREQRFERAVWMVARTRCGRERRGVRMGSKGGRGQRLLSPGGVVD